MPCKNSIELSAEETTNISVPDDMLEYIDKLLTNPELRAVGIDSRAKVLTVLFEMFIERFHGLEPELQEQYENPSDYRTSVTMSKALTDTAEDLAKSKYASTLWLPQKTNIISALLRILLSRYNSEYRRLWDLLEVDIEDIKKFVKHRANI